MPILFNVGAYLIVRILAEAAHLDRGDMFLMGWIAALLAYALIDRFSPSAGLKDSP